MTRIFIVHEEAVPMGAAQIMIGIISSALGTLWMVLYYVEEEAASVGPVLMLLLAFYLFVASAFFIISGSSSIMHGSATKCQITFAIVSNAISAIICIFGIIIVMVEFPAFEAKGSEYIWSNMAGMMLLQIIILCILSEMIIAMVLVDWFRKSFRHEIIRE